MNADSLIKQLAYAIDHERQNLTGERDAWKAKAEEAEKLAIEATQSQFSLNKDLQGRDTEINRLAHALTDVQARYAECTGGCDLLVEKLRLSQRGRDVLYADNATLRVERDQARWASEAAHKAVERLSGEVVDLEGELDSLSKSNRKLWAGLGYTSGDPLAVENARLKDGYNEIYAENKGLLEQISSLRLENIKLDDTRKLLIARIDTLSETNIIFNKTVKRQAAEIALHKDL